MNAEQIIKVIKRNSHFLITAHIDLEGDALGSELALASLLRKLGKKVFIVNASKTPANYNFLPGVKKIHHTENLQRSSLYSKLSTGLEVAFIIDCSDLERIGNTLDLIGAGTKIINIDHHPGNKNFGQINWIELKVSSTGEMVYHLFKQTKVKLDRQDALNIYTAILTDTGSFRHANTTCASLKICSELLELGVDPAKTYAQIYENNSVQDVISAAEVISAMSFAMHNKIAWVEIRQNQFRKLKGKAEILDRILDFAYCISTVKVVLIFCQVNNQVVKISLRSKAPVNVQKLALHFGGGGHRFASGCTLKGSLKEVERRVLRQLKQIMTQAIK